jgi:hypothetical protein
MSQLPVGLIQVGTSVAFVADARLMRQVADSVPVEGVRFEVHEMFDVQVLPLFVRPQSNLQRPSKISAPFAVNAGSGAVQHVVDTQVLLPFVHFPSGPHVAFIWPVPPLQAPAVQRAPADVLRQTRCHSMGSTNTPAGRPGHTLRGGIVLHTAASGESGRNSSSSSSSSSRSSGSSRRRTSDGEQHCQTASAACTVTITNAGVCRHRCFMAHGLCATPSCIDRSSSTRHVVDAETFSSLPVMTACNHNAAWK